MGTAIGEHVEGDQQGIVPRFVKDLFCRLETKRQEHGTEPTVLVSFLELYNEDLVDLLNPQSRKKCEVQIREDVNGHIYWAGVKEQVCESPEALVAYLEKGSLGRTTGSTDMNSVSSRSHAIFSVILKQRASDDQNLVSKFHFVDLAGSERLKRTNAQGDRAREGISINAGLLALGNVISALGDESRRSAHVPYRDSKLTRLLQDSLGGNSQTLMMACVSPSDSNFAETLSTLKYANRARNIKNKVAVNQEFVGSSVQVNQLKAQVMRLTLELQTLKAQPTTLGVLSSNEELEQLKHRVRAMTDEICRLSAERDTLLMERDLTQGELEVSPMILEYQTTIRELRQALSETQARLTLQTSVRLPVLSPHPSSHNNNSKKRAGHAKKRRTTTAHGTTTTTTTARHLTFKSTKRQPKDSEGGDIDAWLKATLGSIQTSASSGLRIDAKESICFAKSQIDRALKVLGDFKGKDDYECEILADDELFERLQCDESLFGDLEESSTQTGTDVSSARRSRMFSTDTLLTDDSEYTDSQPHLTRMLDQIQSDIQVNESLVNQLEKTELEYVTMRKQFETKIYSLHDEILALRQSPQSMQDARQAYEARIKQLMHQLADTKRRYSQATHNIQASRNQNESTLRALRVNVESLKVEKQRMVKRMKDEAERVKDKLQLHEREIQQLKRKQQKDNETKRRLEREAKQLQQILQKKTDESLVSAERIKTLLKKAVREGGVLDERLVSDLGARLPRRTKSSGPALAVRVAQKKSLLDQALAAFIRSKQGADEQRQLLGRKQDLAQKREEYLSEREHLLDQDMLQIDRAFRQIIDENIELVDAEIAYIDTRLQALEPDQTQEWPQALPIHAAPGQCIDRIAGVLRSLEPDEWTGVMESALDDIITLRVQEAHHRTSLQQHEKTTDDLRRTLLVMKKTALDATDDYERRLKQCRRRSRTSSVRLPYEDTSDADSAIDILPEDHFQHVESLFHKIYSESPVRRLSQSKAPMKPSASPLAGRRTSTSSPEQFLQQLLMPSADTDCSPVLLETDSQITRRRAFSFQQPPTAPSPIGQHTYSLLTEAPQDFLLELSPSHSAELRKPMHNVFDRLSGSHTRASNAKKKRTVRFRHSSSSIDDLRRQWAMEKELA